MVLSDEIIENLTSKLRQFLNDFIDKKTDKIGVGFSFLIGCANHLPMRKFSEIVVKASIIDGPEKIVRIISDLKEDKPLIYGSKCET